MRFLFVLQEFLLRDAWRSFLLTHCPLARNVTKKTHKTMCVLEKVVRALLTGSQGLITYAKIGMRVGSSEERRNSLASTLSAMFFANEETKIGMVVLHVKYLRIFFSFSFFHAKSAILRFVLGGGSAT